MCLTERDINRRIVAIAGEDMWAQFDGTTVFLDGENFTAKQLRAIADAMDTPRDCTAGPSPYDDPESIEYFMRHAPEKWRRMMMGFWSTPLDAPIVSMGDRPRYTRAVIQEVKDERDCRGDRL